MTILFIDDDPDDTEMFCEAVVYLNDSDFVAAKKEELVCLTLSDGCKAINFLTGLRELPDYIFLDINMPIMGGRDCLSFLKTHGKFSRIPVIIFSTYFDEKMSSEFKKLGAEDCIHKPSEFNTLVKILSKYIYKRYL